jgi:prepilin-type N-terminal cleavage/methylation domain-containing protein
VHQQAQRGFTIVELMIVVAIIAVLAIVVIPSFIKESKSAGYKSEVHPMFAELGTREDQYKTENSAYLAMTACPTSAVASGTDMTTATCALGGAWLNLRVQSPQQKLKCSYEIRTGNSGVNPSTDASWPTWLATTIAPTSPALSWYFVVATCTSNSYFTASWDATVRSKDGH